MAQDHRWLREQRAELISCVRSSSAAEVTAFMFGRGPNTTGVLVRPRERASPAIEACVLRAAGEPEIEMPLHLLPPWFRLFRVSGEGVEWPCVH